jgi:uncharacterized protein YeeX (DUF496 family)
MAYSRRKATMKTVLDIRRKKLRRELTRVNQQITRTQKELLRLENRIALVAQGQSKAA